MGLIEQPESRRNCISLVQVVAILEKASRTTTLEIVEKS